MLSIVLQLKLRVLENRIENGTFLLRFLVLEEDLRLFLEREFLVSFHLHQTADQLPGRLDPFEFREHILALQQIAVEFNSYRYLVGGDRTAQRFIHGQVGFGYRYGPLRQKLVSEREKYFRSYRRSFMFEEVEEG